MSGSLSQSDFPNLNNSGSTITSPKANRYNCIAWAAGDVTNWWWPFSLTGVSYWPQGVPRQATVESFIQAFGTRGFVECADGLLEDGIEKIALYAKMINSVLMPTHAARQLESGRWTSKLGPLEDIDHPTLEAVSGPFYGDVVAYLSRPRT